MSAKKRKSKGRNKNVVDINSKRQNWKELDDIYQTIAMSLVDISSRLRDSLQVISSAGVGNDPELTSIVRCITSDLKVFTDDLKLTQSKHINYSGIVKDGDELALCLSIFNDYVLLNDRFKTILFTPMLTVTEYLAEATEKLQKQIPPNVSVVQTENTSTEGTSDE